MNFCSKYVNTISSFKNNNRNAHFESCQFNFKLSISQQLQDSRMKATVLIVTALLVISGTSADFALTSQQIILTDSSQFFASVVKAFKEFVANCASQVYQALSAIEDSVIAFDTLVFALIQSLETYVAKTPLAIFSPLLGAPRLLLQNLQAAIKGLVHNIGVALFALLNLLETLLFDHLQFFSTYPRQPDSPERVAQTTSVIEDFFKCLGSIFTQGVTGLTASWSKCFAAVQAFCLQATLLLQVNNPSNSFDVVSVNYFIVN